MPDLDVVHDRLRDILAPYRDELSVTRDGPEGLVLEVPGLEGKPWGYVAGTRMGKRYVSFYLMPVYGSSGLANTISPALRKRMQGKSCFNFTTVDERLLAELSDLAAKGIPGFREVAEQVAASRR
jgi:hypothetical protein